MEPVRISSILVLLASLAGGIYYTVVDKELRGAVVVLLGILYLVGLFLITRKSAG